MTKSMNPKSIIWPERSAAFIRGADAACHNDRPATPAMRLAAATATARAADAAFESALRAHGYNSRWDWQPGHGQTEILAAQAAKHAADAALALAWKEAR